MLGSLIIIPKESRQEVLNKLHALHQGIEKTKRRAKESVYWPNIDDDINKHINFCSKYQTSMPSQEKETLLSDNEPCRICEEVSSDLFSYGGKYYRVYGNRLFYLFIFFLRDFIFKKTLFEKLQY